MAKFLRLIIKFYQIFLSPLAGKNCRFSPSCSQYAVLAIEKHGALKGCILAAKRIARCHPFGSGGYDPPPN